MGYLEGQVLGAMAVLLRIPLALALVAFVSIGKAEQHVQRKTGLKGMGDVVAPNIIFILADDMGYGSLGPVTPFMNFMKEKGVNIPTYYSQELCTPARAALLTGRYPLSMGMQFGSVSETSDFALDLTETTIADVLQENGYTTYMFGKWHLGNASPRHLPTARGFDYYLGFLAGQTDYWSKRCPEHDQFHDFLYSTPQCYYMYDDDDLNHYSTFLYRDKAVEAIQNHNFYESPMFMFLSFQAVHDPWTDVGGKFATGIPEDYFLDKEEYENMYSNITAMYPVRVTDMNEKGFNFSLYFMPLVSI
jgi:Sulfatase